MIENGTLLDVIRFVVGIIILSCASYIDIKTRTAPNKLWILMGGIGIVLLVVQHFTIEIDYLYLSIIPLMFAVAYLLFRTGIIFGGADAKAIMALSLLVPFWPSLQNFPLWQSIMPFPWVIFSNSVLLFLLIPPSLFISNIIKRNLEFPYCLLGYKINIKKAKEKHVWPLERIINGKRKFVYMSTDEDSKKQIRELEKAGKIEIWVTPKIPFMIPLLIGFILSFILGDILFHIVDFVL